MRVVCLLSGGIDSPVAAYMMLKKGCEVVCVHFHQQTATSAGAQNKVIRICKHLKQFGNLKLYMVPFKDIQLELIKSIPAKVRMLVYRRMMLRIAEVFLEKENAHFFVTGDNLGQVASQTLPNLNAVYSVVSKPILTPLFGEDKKDIMRMAREVGTYELSILPYEDCCSFLVDPHPELRATSVELDAVEKSLDVRSLVQEGVLKAKLVDLD